MICALNQTISDMCPLPEGYHNETPSSLGRTVWSVGVVALSAVLYYGKRFYEERTFCRLVEGGIDELRQQKTRSGASRIWEGVRSRILAFSDTHPRFKSRALYETQNINTLYLLALCSSKEPQNAERARLQEEHNAAAEALFSGGKLNMAAKPRFDAAQAASLNYKPNPDVFIANF